MFFRTKESYKKVQLFISTGILVGIWTNLFIQTKNIKLKEKYLDDFNV